MKASEVMDCLQQLIEKYGDLKVGIYSICLDDDSDTIEETFTPLDRPYIKTYLENSHQKKTFIAFEGIYSD